MGNVTPVCLLTDFGTRDPYVGVMKSVLQKNKPYPPVIDLTHEVPPQDERTASFLLQYVLPDCPDEAVVLLVVDPGVGTDRDIIAVETDHRRTVVAPDTGMVDGLNWSRARLVTNEAIARETISSTFHGRDWFAPAGRHLSLGKPFEELGPVKDSPDTGGLVPDARVEGDEIHGEVVHVDRFGNLITNVKPTFLHQALNLSPDQLDRVRISVGNREIRGIANTYGETDGLTGVVGSFERVEIALPGGSARNELDVNRGMPVTLNRQEA